MQAICLLTGESSYARGEVLFYEDEKNKETVISINMKGMKPGKHGIHIHQTGDLRKGCESLGPHYNPFGKYHGGPNDKERHVGDLGNITADKNGNVKILLRDKLIKLRGKYSIVGRSVVVHEDEDDLGKGFFDDSKTTGHSGRRVVCGVIGLL